MEETAEDKNANFLKKPWKEWEFCESISGKIEISSVFSFFCYNLRFFIISWQNLLLFHDLLMKLSFFLQSVNKIYIFFFVCGIAVVFSIHWWNLYFPHYPMPKLVIFSVIYEIDFFTIICLNLRYIFCPNFWIYECFNFWK